MVELLLCHQQSVPIFGQEQGFSSQRKFGVKEIEKAG